MKALHFLAPLSPLVPRRPYATGPAAPAADLSGDAFLSFFTRVCVFACLPLCPLPAVTRRLAGWLGLQLLSATSLFNLNLNNYPSLPQAGTSTSQPTRSGQRSGTASLAPRTSGSAALLQPWEVAFDSITILSVIGCGSFGKVRWLPSVCIVLN